MHVYMFFLMMFTAEIQFRGFCRCTRWYFCLLICLHRCIPLSSPTACLHPRGSSKVCVHSTSPTLLSRISLGMLSTNMFFIWKWCLLYFHIELSWYHGLDKSNKIACYLQCRNILWQLCVLSMCRGWEEASILLLQTRFRIIRHFEVMTLLTLVEVHLFCSLGKFLLYFFSGSFRV